MMMIKPRGPRKRYACRDALDPAYQHDGHRQSGFTLLEVILALGISGIVIGVAVNFYMQSRTMNVLTRSYQIIGDNGSTAMGIVGAYIRDAGYGGSEPWSHFNPVEAAVTCEFNLQGFCSEDNITTVGSDVIALRMNPASDRACNGATVDPDDIIINRFFVDATNDLLMCSAYNVTDGAVITTGFEIQNGIEHMQIEYLLANNSFNSDPNAAIAEGILGVSVSMLVTSTFDAQLLSSANRTYRLLDNTVLTFTNTRDPRQVFQSSFLVNSSYVGQQSL